MSTLARYIYQPLYQTLDLFQLRHASHKRDVKVLAVTRGRGCVAACLAIRRATQKGVDGGTTQTLVVRSVKLLGHTPRSQSSHLPGVASMSGYQREQAAADTVNACMHTAHLGSSVADHECGCDSRLMRETRSRVGCSSTNERLFPFLGCKCSNAYVRMYTT